MARRRRGFEGSRWGAPIRACDICHIVFALYALAFSTQHSASARSCRMKDFRDLQVWHKAHSLVLASYRSTGGFPKQEMYGMTSQIRRCAASVAANIAEGCGKRGNGEFQRYLTIAAASASALEYHSLLTHDLSLMDETSYRQLNASGFEVKHMLASLIR